MRNANRNLARRDLLFPPHQAPFSFNKLDQSFAPQVDLSTSDSMFPFTPEMYSTNHTICAVVA